MSETTKIQWCDATFNPWIGCTKVSPGCAHCYAEVDSASRALGVGWGKGWARHRTSAKNWNKVRGWNRRPWKLTGEAALDQGGRRPRVFCASLADWLDDEVPIEWLEDLLKLIHETPNLDWLLLTKRPENFRERLESVLDLKDRRDESDLNGWRSMVAKWIEWAGTVPEAMPPANVWFGVSVEDQARAAERIPLLLKIPARVRFLSVEPMLGRVELNLESPIANRQAPIDWVIVGGESGPGARPCNVDWVRSIVGQCKAAGVACFVKQFGSHPIADSQWPIAKLRHPKGGDPGEWPEDLRVREFPDARPDGD